MLDLRILTEHILVDTATEECLGSDPLLTICPISDCDVQQNAAYAWESRHVGMSLDQIDVTRSEAQAVVNAIFADYLPRTRPPTVSFSSEQAHGHADRSEIVLGTDVRYLGPVVHELAHAIVSSASVRDPGHGGAFTAMLLSLWERYFPIVDVDAARDDAERHGIEIASHPPVRARHSDANTTIGELFCSPRLEGSRPDLCDASSGAMLEHLSEEIVGLYVGYGSRGDDFWWGVDEDADPIRSYVIKETAIHRMQALARLQLVCRENRVDLDILWDLDVDLDWTVRYRVGNGAVQTEEWQVGVSLGDDLKWTGRENAGDLISQMAWAAQAGGWFTVEAHERNNPSRRYTVTFDLDGLFDTPVQPNLARCGR